MKITLDILKRYGARESYLKTFNELYPDGATPMEIMRDGKMPLEALHFGYKYLSVSEEEIQYYKEICNIDSASRFCWYSSNIRNGEAVMHSNNITNCQYVLNCDTARDCREITNSKNLVGSEEVYNSTDVKESTFVMNSSRIEDSNYVVGAQDIGWGKYIMGSTKVDDCKFIYHSDNISDCYMSGFLTNCNHCLFCSGLSDADYYIFNERVEPDVFEYWKQALLEQIIAEQVSMITIDSNKHNTVDRYMFVYSFASVFDGLSDEFFEWIKTVPGATGDKCINLFFGYKNFLK